MNPEPFPSERQPRGRGDERADPPPGNSDRQNPDGAVLGLTARAARPGDVLALHVCAPHVDQHQVKTDRVEQR